MKAFSIMSIEAAPETNGKPKTDVAKLQPWLTIFGELATPKDRALALEAWRIANQTVKKGVQPPSF
jgi:hypothetical protein